MIVFKEFLQTSIPPLISVLYIKGYHDFPLNIFVSHCRVICRGTPLFLRKFRVSKNLMPKRGISRFPKKNLLCHSTETFRRGTLLCFTKCLVTKKFINKSSGWGEYQEFPAKIFCLTVPKVFLGEPFCAVF